MPEVEQGQPTAIAGIRRSALREGALTLGTQHGYRRRAWEIERRLEHRSNELSVAFDFGRVAAPAPLGLGYVVPPVVAWGFDASSVKQGGKGIAGSREFIALSKPGRLTPVVPTWRDHLLMVAPVPNRLPPSLLPHAAEERLLFARWFREGWRAGRNQANREFKLRMQRLKREYLGMLKYRELVSQGVINQIVLARSEYGTTVEGAVLRIDDRAVEIVSAASFEVRRNRWRLPTNGGQSVIGRR
ncbi:MAG: type IV secretory system conjugative DNA transfer family protein [Rhodobacteraceae bacterium]|nr:type IV secretory system conjugative DNA transfer family protein [Paracoccaceae bacterium]